MKFTNGYWLMRDNIEPLFAVEYADHRIQGDQLTVYAATRHVNDRGDCLNSGLLTIRFTSPMEDVIHVSITHFDGARYDGPFVPVSRQPVSPVIREEENKLIYQSGALRAEISREPSAWSVTYYEGQERLTDSSWRNMAYMKDRDSKKTYMTEQLAIDVDELIYGMGERFTPFVRNGQTVEMWNEDGGTASEIAYKNVPFYITSKGYGVLVDNEGDAAFEVASEKVERVQFSVEGERLDYYLIGGGTPKGTIQKYTELTGKPALPPAWSFGLWLSTSFTTNYDEETTGNFIRGMEERQIPLHVFHFDCYWMDAYEWCNFQWDPKTFPDPKAMLKRYHDRGLKICVWINPYIGQKSPLFGEAMEGGYLIRRRDGSVWQTDLWQAGRHGNRGLYQSGGLYMVSGETENPAGYGRGLLQDGFRRKDTGAGRGVLRSLGSGENAQFLHLSLQPYGIRTAGAGAGRGRSRSLRPVCHGRQPAVPGTLGRRLLCHLSVHGGNVAGRTFPGLRRLRILEP